jgi:hypothetical protein
VCVCVYCAFKINLQCCTTQRSFRGEIFHDFPRYLVKITENRGNSGKNIAPRNVVCVPSLQINSESTICVSQVLDLLVLHCKCLHYP